MPDQLPPSENFIRDHNASRGTEGLEGWRKTRARHRQKRAPGTGII